MSAEPAAASDAIESTAGVEASPGTTPAASSSTTTAAPSRRGGGRGVHVVTLGDSTIDNLIWMDRDPVTGRFAYDDCVVAKLRKGLHELHAAGALGGGGDAGGAGEGAGPPASATATPLGAGGAETAIGASQLPSPSEAIGTPAPRVVNLAADGFTSENVLRGAPPLLSRAAWAEHGQPFPVRPAGAAGAACTRDKGRDGLGGVLAPLDELERLHQRDPVSHVVLSVGGNDVREILRAMHHLPRIVQQLLLNYRAICERVLALPAPRPRLVLMMQYLPALEQGHYGVYSAIGALPGPGGPLAKLCTLMEQVYSPVLALARAHGLTVIDLPRTLDPRETALFRLQIEPSARGSDVIARLITAAVARTAAAAVATPRQASVLLSARPQDGYQHVEAEPNDFDAGAGRPYAVLRDGVFHGEDARGSGSHGVAAASAPAQALPHAVRQLVDMGFPEARVRAALAASGNLPQQALDLLLAEGQ